MRGPRGLYRRCCRDRRRLPRLCIFIGGARALLRLYGRCAPGTRQRTRDVQRMVGGNRHSGVEPVENDPVDVEPVGAKTEVDAAHLNPVPFQQILVALSVHRMQVIDRHIALELERQRCKFRRIRSRHPHLHMALHIQIAAAQDQRSALGHIGLRNLQRHCGQFDLGLGLQRAGYEAARQRQMRSPVDPALELHLQWSGHVQTDVGHGDIQRCHGKLHCGLDRAILEVKARIFHE